MPHSRLKTAIAPKADIAHRLRALQSGTQITQQDAANGGRRARGEVGMLVNSPALYFAILLLHFVAYLTAPVVLFRRGWPIAAGVAMLVSALLPIAGQVWFTDSDAPGLAFLLMLEAPPALLVLAVGIGITATRTIKRLRGHNA